MLKIRQMKYRFVQLLYQFFHKSQSSKGPQGLKEGEVGALLPARSVKNSHKIYGRQTQMYQFKQNYRRFS